jgi:hypothetical protein
MTVFIRPSSWESSQQDGTAMARIAIITDPCPEPAPAHPAYPARPLIWLGHQRTPIWKANAEYAQHSG